MGSLEIPLNATWVALGIGIGCAFYVTAAANLRERAASRGHNIAGRQLTAWGRARDISFAIMALAAVSSLIAAGRPDFGGLSLFVALNFVYAGVSLLWAREKGISLPETLRWLATGSVALALGALSLQECATVVAAAAGVFLVGGMVEEIQHGSPVDDGYYRWFGGIGTNRQATSACIFLATTIFLALADQIPLALTLASVTLGGTVLVLTRSLTVTWAAGAAGATWMALMRPEWRTAMAWAGFGIIAIVAGVLIGSPARRALVRALQLGRPVVHWATLGGRRQIWSFAWREMRGNRWFGVGYRGFWSGARQERWRAAHPHRRYYNHSHSQYLELMEGGGVVALLLFLTTIGYALGSVRPIQLDSAFIIAMIVFVLIDGVCEVSFVLPRFEACVFFALLLASHAYGV